MMTFCNKCRNFIKGDHISPGDVHVACGGVLLERTLNESDPVNHPKNYTGHPSGIECITITEHMGFNLGNAVKYVWRADLKNDAIEDLKKARWYIDREISKREKGQSK